MEYLIYISIAFIISFLLTTTEFALKNFPNTYSILFKRSFPFYLFGSIYGFMSIGFYFLLYTSGSADILPTGMGKHLAAAFTAGVSLRALLKISLYDFRLNESKVSVGTEFIADIIEKMLSPAIEETHDNSLITYIKHVEKKHLATKPLSQLIDELTQHVPLRYTTIEKESLIAVMQNQKNAMDVINIFISKCGFSRFKNYVKNIS